LCFIAGGYSATELRNLERLADEVVDVGETYPAPPWFLVDALRRTRTTRGFRRSYPKLFSMAARLELSGEADKWWRRLEFYLEGLQSLRYIHYLDVLESNPAAEVVMLSDVRDVIFQRDPFAETVSGLEFALEDDSIRVGDEVFNTRWLRELYGDDFVATSRGRLVSCSGTTFGEREPMLTYLRLMVAEITGRRLPMGSRDQGAHNAVISRADLPDVRLVPNGRGRVLTLGGVKMPRIGAGGCLMNDDGSTPAVVHQWDRHPAFLDPFRLVECARELARTSSRRESGQLSGGG
jgi:hypothetical protein